MIVSARRKKSIDVGVDVDSNKHSRGSPLRGEDEDEAEAEEEEDVREGEEHDQSFNVQCSDAVPFIAVVRGGMIKVLVLGVLSVVAVIGVGAVMVSHRQNMGARAEMAENPSGSSTR